MVWSVCAGEDRHGGRPPGVKSRLAALDAEPVGSTPEAFRKFIDAEMIRWRSVVESAQIRAE